MSHENFQEESRWENFFTIIFLIPWFVMNDDGNDLTYNTNCYNSTCQSSRSRATFGKLFLNRESILMSFSSIGMDLTSVLAFIVRAGRCVDLSAQRGGWGLFKNIREVIKGKNWRCWRIIYRFSISLVDPWSEAQQRLCWV